MTCRVKDNSNVSAAIELLCEQGFEGLGDAVSLLINQAMELERSKHLQAGPYERTPDRQGYANGYKPKSVKTRVGRLDL
jgi:transposase-like protein